MRSIMNDEIRPAEIIAWLTEAHPRVAILPDLQASSIASTALFLNQCHRDFQTTQQTSPMQDRLGEVRKAIKCLLDNLPKLMAGGEQSLRAIAIDLQSQVDGSARDFNLRIADAQSRNIELIKTLYTASVGAAEGFHWPAKKMRQSDWNEVTAEHVALCAARLWRHADSLNGIIRHRRVGTDPSSPAIRFVQLVLPRLGYGEPPVETISRAFKRKGLKL